MSISNRRRWLSALLIVIGISVCGELLLRLVGFGTPILVTPNKFTSYELLPDQSIHRTWPLSDSWVSHIRTNHSGMRSDDIPDNKPPGVLRVYFLGDSYTYGTTQVDQSQIFTSLLQRDLPAILHQPVEVLNGSISGWAISNELAYLREHGTFHADRVILVLNAGDPGQPESILGDNMLTPSTLHHPRSGYEELWFRVVVPWTNRLRRSFGIGTQPPALSNQDPGVELSDDAQVIEQNLECLTAMKSYVASQGSSLSIIFIGQEANYDTPRNNAMTATGKDALIGWAKAHQVAFLDVETALGRPLGNSVLLRDHVHPNVLGHRRIATEIEQNWGVLTEVPPSIAQSSSLRR